MLSKMEVFVSGSLTIYYMACGMPWGSVPSGMLACQDDDDRALRIRGSGSISAWNNSV